MSGFSRAWLFLAITCIFTWACQAPAIIALRAQATPPPIVLLVMAIGSAGPSLVALWFWLLERKSLQKQLPTPTAWSPPLWLLWTFALAFNPLAHLIGSGVLLLFGQYTAQHVLYPPLAPEQIAIAVIAPLGEEFGFRGYALPRLQARMSPLAASLCIGVVWAVWHLPTLLVPGARGTSPIELWLYLLTFVSGSVVYTWLYNAGRGSVVGPVLAHLGVHLDNVFRASTLGDGVRPLAVTVLSMTGIAVCLVATGQLRPATAIRYIRRGPAARSTGLAKAALAGEATARPFLR
jgi:membrane protease YdiL (CAAX protease family)